MYFRMFIFVFMNVLGIKEYWYMIGVIFVLFLVILVVYGFVGVFIVIVIIVVYFNVCGFEESGKECNFVVICGRVNLLVCL